MIGADEKKMLMWIPVILLPAANIILALSSSRYEMSVAWILGAVTEELFYRWFLLKKVFFETTKLKPILSILIVSALFAGMHLWNLQTSQTALPVLMQVFSAFCFSVWAGAVVWRTDRVLIPLIAHILLNATAGEAEIAWVSVLVSIAVLADGIMLMRSNNG